MNPFETRNRFGPLPYVFGALLGVALGLVVVSGVLFYKSSRSTVASESAAQRGQDRVREAGRRIDDSRESAIVLATEKVAPAVVTITAKHTQVLRNPFRSPFSREWLEFFGIPETYKREVLSLGSGVIIEKGGYILTNEHVVHAAQVLEVTLSDGTGLPASIVATAPDYDLALLKVDRDDLPHATLGDSNDLRVGEWAIAIGQPFGQLLYDTQPTVTVGVISALHRDIRQDPNSDKIFKDMIQTDAAINPGNSGGPLINSLGEVIGINTFIFSAGGGNLGMGFAIPVNRGKWVLDEIRQYGRVREPWIGLRVLEVTPEAAASLNLKVTKGLLIREIDDGSPANKAGLKPGDLIMAINGSRVATVPEANRLIFGAKVGEKLKFEIDRRGSKRELVVELEEQPDEI